MFSWNAIIVAVLWLLFAHHWESISIAVTCASRAVGFFATKLALGRWEPAFWRSSLSGISSISLKSNIFNMSKSYQRVSGPHLIVPPPLWLDAPLCHSNLEIAATTWQNTLWKEQEAHFPMLVKKNCSYICSHKMCFVLPCCQKWCNEFPYCSNSIPHWWRASPLSCLSFWLKLWQTLQNMKVVKMRCNCNVTKNCESIFSGRVKKISIKRIWCQHVLTSLWQHLSSPCKLLIYNKTTHPN